MSEFNVHRVQWTSDKVSRFWAYLTSTPHAERSYFSAMFAPRLVKTVRRWVPLQGRRVVDYGCGPGFLIEHLLRLGVRAEGIEFSAATADKARKRCEAYANFGGVTVARELPSPIEAGVVDVLFLVEVIEHLLGPQKDATLEEIRRLLKVGGFLVLTTPHAEDLERVSTLCPDCGGVFHPWQHMSSFDRSTLPALLQRHGISTVLCRVENFGARWSGRLLRQMRRLVSGASANDEDPHLLFIGRRVQ
jgi:SAM-dependent methyltransferase